MVPSFGFKSPLTTWYSLRISSEVPLGNVGFIRKLLTHRISSEVPLGNVGFFKKLLTHRISSEVPLGSVCFNGKLNPQKDFTKGGVQGKRRHLESAVTHHPFHSQPPELFRANLEYCENLNRLSFEICQVAEILFGRKIGKSSPILAGKMRQIILQDLQFLHDMKFTLSAGIDISKGLPPPVNDNVKVRVIPHAFLETFYHLRDIHLAMFRATKLENVEAATKAEESEDKVETDSPTGNSETS
ncbi:hypothetical protein CMV_015099 [Castanea mollissima]|uniref:Uncharacterized protein n=1 Tax=Castanea mollissima TaxID=60419 RepID=A0A8J4QW91_9ROSI|nr:hypothetical protein CMV_015099 [Castanea mollissima]